MRGSESEGQAGFIAMGTGRRVVADRGHGGGFGVLLFVSPCRTRARSSYICLHACVVTNP